MRKRQNLVALILNDYGRTSGLCGFIYINEKLAIVGVVAVVARYHINLKPILCKKRSGIFSFPTSNPVAAHAANRFSSSQHLSNFLKLKDVTLTIFYLTNTVITYRVIPEKL